MGLALIDPATGIRKIYHVDRITGALTIQRIQDVAPILDRNKALTTHDDGYNKRRTMRRVASIPTVLVEKWLKEGIDVFNPDHAPALRRKLNDGEFMWLRTAEGSL